jgi:hypothetical protein
MNKLADWIKTHQTIAFFFITFTITWGLGFSYSAAQIKGNLWLYPVASLATCGPALAGIIITTLTHTQPRQGTRKAFWIAFFVAWVVSTLVWLAFLTLFNNIPFSPGVVVFSPCRGDTGRLRDQHGVFAHPRSEKLPVFIDPAARCVEMGPSGPGVLPGFGLTFDSHL